MEMNARGSLYTFRSQGSTGATPHALSKDTVDGANFRRELLRIKSGLKDNNRVDEFGTVDTHTRAGRNVTLGIHRRRAALRNDGDVGIFARPSGGLFFDAERTALFPRPRFARQGAGRASRDRPQQISRPLLPGAAARRFLRRRLGQLFLRARAARADPEAV